MIYQVALLIAEQIENFGKKRDIGDVEFLPALDIFENEMVSVLSDVEKYVDTTKPSLVEFKRERKFLHRLSDVRSELVMILYVLEQQKVILEDLLNDTEDCDPNCLECRWLGGTPKWDLVENARSTLRQYEERIKKIDGDAEQIEKAVQDILELKRTYSSIKDAHSSVLLSTAVIGFTVITVVFAPLTFLTALFALKINGFDKLQVNGSDPDSPYRSDYMGGIFVSSEALTIALTAVAVIVSLRYIRSWDRLEEEDLKKETVGKGKSKACNDELGSKGGAGKSDLESQ
ncbi:hypothetical protein W97_08420 [Coniosporium apollinis CBS 100218]|uniref:Ankyrin repeat protein n=1 Tax=Coniosporium apollinis (strain CBS 100218) TaxID=1168221 RepID=R7Z4Z5_CONA1|nr:uncharacterized protein W97_08420 [Coniosporium apollinis CBS 100218]EON69260.1 hypothetical protein W97_08420 [Coniosporium apollinis CBS 100218]